VNDLIATGPQNGGAQDLLRIRGDHYLHETLSLAFFDRTIHFRHRAFSD
jgi:hypothetical protein